MQSLVSAGPSARGGRDRLERDFCGLVVPGHKLFQKLPVGQPAHGSHAEQLFELPAASVRAPIMVARSVTWPAPSLGRVLPAGGTTLTRLAANREGMLHHAGFDHRPLKH